MRSSFYFNENSKTKPYKNVVASSTKFILTLIYGINSRKRRDSITRI
jgi:hypothetical protein